MPNGRGVFARGSLGPRPGPRPQRTKTLRWLGKTSNPPFDVPQSLATFTEPVNFDNELAKMIPATYIEFTQNPELFTHETSPNKSWATAISRGWTVFSLKSSHNAQRSNPHKLADLLERAVK